MTMQRHDMKGISVSKTRNRVLGTRLSVVAALTATGADAGEPYFEQIIYPEAVVVTASATGINGRGDIVAQVRTANAISGFLRKRDGQYVPVACPGAFATNAWGIDRAGGSAAHLARCLPATCPRRVSAQ